MQVGGPCVCCIWPSLLLSDWSRDKEWCSGGRGPCACPVEVTIRPGTQSGYWQTTQRDEDKHKAPASALPRTLSLRKTRQDEDKHKAPASALPRTLSLRKTWTPFQHFFSKLPLNLQ